MQLCDHIEVVFVVAPLFVKTMSSKLFVSSHRCNLSLCSENSVQS